MQLLKGRTLEVERRFAPESMSLNLVDAGVSTATMTLGPDAPEIGLGRWLRDDTAPGKGIVWRVKTVDIAIETGTRTVQLEHIVATLKDGLIFGEMGSKDSAMPAKTAARNVLAKQSVWTLGTFEFDRSLPYSFSNVTHYAALESICSTLEDSRWEYDLSKLPFRLNIVRKDSSNVGTEMRAGRNLQSIRRTVDMTGMFTRFYPVGARNMHISGDYVGKNESVYGVIARTETDQSKTSKTMLKEWALHRLRRHCEPTVTITIKGLDLSQSTGEPLDSLTLGRVCRAPLPEFGTTISQYIIRLSWADKIKAPEDVTVTLSNHRTDATTNLAQTIKHMSSSHSANSGGGAAAAEEDHAWIVDTTDKVGLVAESIIGRDPTGKAVDWSRVSEIIVDGEGIHQRVVATEGELVVAETRIDANENRILLEAQRATEAEGELSSRLTVTANAITAEVSRATEAEGTITGMLSVEADRITTAVGRITDAEGRITDAEGEISTIEGSTLWQNRDSITAAAGKLSVDKDGNLVVNEGAELKVYSDGKVHTVNALAGKVTVNSAGNVVVDGASLFVKDDQGKTSNVTAVAGKFEVTAKGNVRVTDGTQFYIQRNGAAIEVVDKGNVITAIRASSEGVKIQAAKVDLGDYATVGQLDAQKSRITNLTNGTTQATLLKTKNLTVASGGEFNFKGRIFNSSSITYVSSVSLTKPSIDLTSNRNFMYANTYHGDYSGTSAGKLVNSFRAGSLSVSTKTKYFLVEDN